MSWFEILGIIIVTVAAVLAVGMVVVYRIYLSEQMEEHVRSKSFEAGFVKRPKR